MHDNEPKYESLFEGDPYLQAFTNDLLTLRNADGTPLSAADRLRIARTLDQPHLAHELIHTWDVLIVDRRRTFSSYLWPLIKDRPIGRATREDVRKAVAAAAATVREDIQRFRDSVDHATFLQ